MTPLEHYREAEGLLALANRASEDWWQENGALIFAQAQIHATLANAHMTAGAWGNAAIHSETITHEPFEGCCDEGKP